MAFQSPTAAFTAAELAPTIPEKWAPFIQNIKTSSLSVLNFAQDLSYLIEEGGDIINIPNIFTNTLSVSTQSTEGAGVVDQSPAQGSTTLTVDTHRYIAYVLGDKTMMQIAKQYKLSEEYASQATSILLQSIEADLFGLYSSLTTTDTGSASTALTDLAIRQSIQTLTSTENAVFEMDKLAFFLHPAVYWGQVQGIAKYYDKSISTGSGIDNGSLNANFGANASKRSLMGNLYGIPVYVSPQIPVATNVSSNMLLHDSAFSFGMHTQGTYGIRVQADYLLQNLATLAVVDIIFGVSCTRPNAGVEIKALNTETTA